MIERRDLLRGAALGAAVLSAQSVSACSLVEFEPDHWGEKLIRYFRTGSSADLDGLFKDFSTLVSFDPYFVQTEDQIQFSGSASIVKAMQSFRSCLTRKLHSGPRKLIEAKIVGNEQEGRMNRIELLFAEGQTVETGCGPDRNEMRVDLYYQAGVYETGYDWVKWAVKRLAILPPLEIGKLNV